MKFVCQQCNTKYAIDDARVRGKVLKIRCKACQFLMTVRDPSAPEPRQPAPEPARPAARQEDNTEVSGVPDEMMAPSPSRPLTVVAPPTTEWFVSFDGEQEGPYAIDRARDRVRAEVGAGKEAFGWREGFTAWLPVDNLPEFAVALRPAAPPPAPLRRSGLSGPIAAPTVRTGPTALRGSTVARVAVRPGVPSERRPPTSPTLDSVSARNLAEALPAQPAAAPAPLAATGRNPRPRPTATLDLAVAIEEEAALAAMPATVPSLAVPVASQPVSVAPSVAPSAGVAALQAALRSPETPPAMYVTATPPNRTMLYLLIGMAVISVGLFTAVMYLALRPAEAPPSLAVAPARPVAEERAASRPETPAAAPAAPSPAPAEVAAPAGAAVAARVASAAQVHRHAPAAHAPGPRAEAPAAPAALSADQQRLAEVYRDQDKSTPDRIPRPAAVEHKQEQVSDTQIMGVVTRGKKMVQICFERSLKHDPLLKNLRVDVELKIGISGSVTGVALADPKIANSELGTCLKQTIRRWHFPAQDSEYQTAFPLLLQAQ